MLSTNWCVGGHRAFEQWLCCWSSSSTPGPNRLLPASYVVLLVSAVHLLWPLLVGGVNVYSHNHLPVTYAETLGPT